MTNDTYKKGDRLEWKNGPIGHINSMVVTGVSPLTVKHQWSQAIGTVPASQVQPYNHLHR